MKMNSARMLAAAIVGGAVAMPAFAGLLDNAWLMGTTDKNPLTYKPGEEMVFTITPKDLEGEVPAGEFFLDWKMTDDFGANEKGKVPLTGEPFVYRTKLDKAGFVRLEVYVVDKKGARYLK